ncbi:MAG: phage antirepressor protein, partial [Clostridium sp.]
MDKDKSIKLFEQKTIRTHWDEEQEKWFFSIQDVVEVLAETPNPKDYIKKMKRRDEELSSNWGTICPLVEMTGADGRRRKIQAA